MGKSPSPGVQAAKTFPRTPREDNDENFGSSEFMLVLMPDANKGEKIVDPHPMNP